MAINPVNNALYNTNWLFGTNNNQKQDPIANLWSGFNSYQSNAINSLTAVSEVNADVKALLASYEDAKKEFLDGLDDSMENLAASAEKVKGYNFKVDTEDAITTVTNTDKDGKVTTSTKYSKDLQAAIDTVKGLVDDYNSAIKFFGDYSSVSKHLESATKIFGDTTYRAKSYASIGLNVASDGSLIIDESKLANAIVNDPTKVSSILGQDGLAGKAEDHVSYANRLRNQFFPSAEVMLKDQLNDAGVYLNGNYGKINNYTNTGNLVNAMY